MRMRGSAILLAGALFAAAPAVADWKPILQRQANLFARIDAGVRNGSLTEREAGNLRARFARLALRDEKYRRGGYSAWEMNDLQRRYDDLSARVRYQKNDDDARR